MEINILETTEVQYIWHSLLSMYIRMQSWKIQTNITFNKGPNFKAFFGRYFVYSNMASVCIWTNLNFQ